MYVRMYVYLVVKTIHLYRTHPFILRTTIVALGSQGRNTETRLKQAAQIVGQFCTAVTGNFSRSKLSWGTLSITREQSQTERNKIIANVGTTR
jgi:hypothetical protein